MILTRGKKETAAVVKLGYRSDAERFLEPPVNAVVGADSAKILIEPMGALTVK